MTVQFDMPAAGFLQTNAGNNDFIGYGMFTYINLFTSALPAACTNADPTGSVLASAANLNGFANTASDNLATLQLISPVTLTIAHDGTIASFRLYDTWSHCTLQGTVGVTGSGADMTFDAVAVTSGATLYVTDLSFTLAFGLV